MKKGSLIYCLFLIFMIVNCATSTAGITTSNIPIINKKYKVIGPVEERVGWLTIDFAIVAFPTRKPPIDDAFRMAMNSKDADALVNIRYWMDKSIFLCFTYNRLGISADAIKFEEEVPEPNAKKGR
jgi:hypothetical protein